MDSMLAPVFTCVCVCVCVFVCRREKNTEAAVVVVYNKGGGSIDTRVQYDSK